MTDDNVTIAATREPPKRRCHCGAEATPNDYPDVCDAWPICERKK